MAAAVVNSFMFEAGARGMCGLRSATTRPLSSSTISMLASELCEIELLTSEFRRCSNVAPTAIGSGGAAGLRALRVAAGFFFGALFLFFFDWPSTLGSRRAMSRTARIATRREGRIIIVAQDTFLGGGSLQSWCYGSAS
jgi:hypothetical protein